MKQLPDQLLKDLICHVSILIDNIDTKGKSSRICDVVRLAKNDLKKLERINSPQIKK